MEETDAVFTASGEYQPQPAKRGRPPKLGSKATGLRSQSLSSLPADEDRRDAKRARCTPECMLCDKQIENKVLFLNCAGCEGTVCTPCSKIPPQLAAVLQAGPIPGFQWTCPSCTKTLPTIRKMEQTLEEIKDKNETRMTALESKIDSVMQKIDDTVENKLRAEMPKLQATVEESVTQSINATVTENLNLMETKIDTFVADKMKEIDNKLKDIESKRSEVDVVKIRQEIEEKIQEKIPPNMQQQDSPNTQMKKTLATVTAELRDREDRKKNLVLHNVPEPDTNVKEERNKEDKEFFNNLCKNTLGVNLPQDSIVRTTRFGEKNKEKPRPLWISLRTEDLKKRVFSKLAKLHGTDYDYVSFGHDMTKIEREEKQKLTADAKKLEEADKEGKFRYRVRGPPWDMKIVKLPKKTDPEADNQKGKKM